MDPTKPSNIREAVEALSHVESHFLTEAATRAIYSRVVRMGDVVLDCGANRGDHSRPLAALVGPSGRVHAFEPNSQLFHHLLGLGPNLRLWPFAIGESLAIRTLHVPDGLDGWASLLDIRNMLADRHVTLWNTPQVPIDALTEIADASVSFVKIDVEGNELFALRGMRRLLERSQPVIILENINPEIAALLDEMGYVCHELTGGLIEDGRSALPNSAALPRSFSTDRVAGLLLTDDEFHELHQQAIDHATAHKAASAAADAHGATSPRGDGRPREPETPIKGLTAVPGMLAVPDSAASTSPGSEEVLRLKAQLRETEAQLVRLTGSLSWRVTSPLRFIRGLVR